ncbi:hypothetical protein [Photobacterium sp.]|uniref:hypothetical protein n=1 Tax=Photobacterium sp. TaxID=660 RepID=UPI00299EAA8A|nr:hypothetical protein [Photobacterium sp.]MDX1302110.1 hypothetical protein [Photobacterium sp.]
MGVDLKADSQFVQFPLSFDPKLYLDQIQTWIEAGKTLEIISATQLQQAIGGSYKHALIALEEVERVIRLSHQQENNDHESSELVFPFDVINRTNNTLFDTWRVMMGVGTKAEEDLGERLETEKQKQHANEAFYSDRMAALEAAARENDKRLMVQNAAYDKAIKEKQAAQRSVEKQKAELDKSTEKILQLTMQLDKAVTLNHQLKGTNTELQSQVAELEKTLSDTRLSAKQSLNDLSNEHKKKQKGSQQHQDDLKDK